MTFRFESERITALSPRQIPMGHICFPQVRPGLVNITQVVTHPDFRGQGVAAAMMEALLTHLAQQDKKAALTCPFAQQYVSANPQWNRILPAPIHFETH